MSRGATRTRGTLPLVVAVVAAIMLALALPALAGPAKTRLVSQTSAGEPADGDSALPSVSASGRYVAFESDAENLQGGGPNPSAYVHDRKTGKTTLVSRTPAGDPAAADVAGLGGAISADGRYVVFDSRDPGFPGDHTGFISNVYRRDLKTGKTVLVSRSSAGVPADGASRFATISASGRFVAFQSEAINLAPLGGIGIRHVYIRDLKTGKTRLASRTSAGEPADGTQSVGPLISPSGRYVGFESDADNLGGDDAYTDVFVHDRKTGRTRLISQNSAGEPATGNDSYGGWISASGRYVGFESGAVNLPGNHTDLQFNSYVRDLKTGKTKLVSKTSGGAPTTGGGSATAALSASGRYVAFRSEATNLPGDDTVWDAYVHDRKTGKTKLVSKTSGGAAATGGDSLSPAISASGAFVAFHSLATNLPGDDSVQDVYLSGPLR